MKTHRILTGLGGFLLLAISAASPLLAMGDFADVVFVGGRVVTMTSPEDIHEALAVSGNRILRVGSDAEVLALSGPDTRRVDLAGRAVYPGFIDPHTHLLNDAWQLQMSLYDAQALALRHGITCAANMYTTRDLVEDCLRMARAGDLRVRFSLYLVYNTSCGDVLGDWYAAYEPLVELAPRLRIGGVKFFSETSVCGDRRIGVSFSPALAAYLTPEGQANYGGNRPLFTEAAFTAAIRQANARGFPVAIHAIGDAGIELSLDAIEGALDGGPNTLRNTVMHNLFLRDDLLPRYAELGIVAAIESMSPCFAGFYRGLLAPEMQHVVRRWADLLATGVHVAADSDWPWSAEEAIDPLFRLQALLVPDNRSASYPAWEPCPLLPEAQLLTAWQGLRMMTVEAAYMLHQERDLGTLEPGKLADLVVLSADPLQVSADDLTSIDVVLTMVDGRVEWEP
ncbi:MAG: amidohydrolase family protein [Candidatus Bipolaricaulota bacterium]